MFSSTSAWKMFRFKQNFHETFTMNYVFHQHKGYVFIATIGVILTSYLHDRACDTIDLLAKETPDFISLTSWPPNIPDLNLVDYDHIMS